jgi:hypothetical protein
MTLLDSWGISSQGHFTKNNDLFPRKVSESFNGCPMKEAVKDGFWYCKTQYVHDNHCDGSAANNVEGLEKELLRIILHRMNMTFVHVHTKEPFDIYNFPVDSLFSALIVKIVYLVLGSMEQFF